MTKRRKTHVARPQKGAKRPFIFRRIRRDVARDQILKVLELREQESKSIAYQLKLVIEHAPAAVAMLDRNMTYLWVSNRWAADFRLKAADCIGRSHYAVFPEIPERWKAVHQRCLKGSVEKSDEDQFIRADGKVDWTRWEIRPWFDQKDQIGGILIFSEDISQQKSAQDALTKANKELELRIQELASDHAALARLHEFSSRLFSQTALATFWDTVIEAAVVVSEAHRGALFLYDEGSKSLRLVAQKESQQASIGCPSSFSISRIACNEAVRLGKRVIVEDVTRAPLFHGISVWEAADKEETRAVQAIPLVSRDARLLGVCSIHWIRPHHPDGTTLRMLDLLTREAANIIEYHQREDVLRLAKEEAEKGNHAKDLFLATLSHELRTPLTAILGWAQLLRREGIDPATASKGIQTIEESAFVQGQLIEDLLDVSRIVMGKLVIELEDTDLAVLLRRVIDSVRPAAGKKSINIIDSLGSRAAFVRSDPARLSQVFWNLLTNSIKFTPPGGRVEVALEVCEENLRQAARIRVCDTGKGINPEFLPRLFDRFSQADSSNVRVHGGLGLGLALVRSLLELQAGTVEAASPGEGKGATFTVCLPLIEVPFSIQNAGALTSSVISPKYSRTDGSPDLSGVRVLYVDDEEKTREVMLLALTSFGAVVRLAASVKEALQVLQKFNPNVIVSDIAMPEEDGYDLIQKIRELESCSEVKIPMIALTAFAGPENLKQALSFGFQRHLCKPVDVRHLAQTIWEQHVK